MIDQDQKSCPLRTCGVVYCQRSDCAWWDRRSDQCAIQTIAAGTKHLSDMARVLDKQLPLIKAAIGFID